MTTLYRLLSVFFLLALPIHQVGAEARFDESSTLVDGLISRIAETVNQDHTPESIRAETNSIIDTYFDYPLIARFAAGNAWRKASKPEREEFTAVFREVLLTLAETQFSYLRTLEYTPGQVVPKGPKLVIVSGVVKDKAGEFPDAQVAWRVSTPKGKPPKIIDIEVENISMLVTQQQEHTSIINSNGGSFQALIDALREQAASLKDGAASSS
jgi:phospholipid transport system substrate-binding protein